jgi:putative ABC transport system substrate-binding protein
VEGPADLVTAFAEMQKPRADALIVSSSALFYVHRARLVELAAKHRVPTIYHQSEFVVGHGASCPTGLTSATSSAGRPDTWTKFSEAPNPAISLSNSRPSLSL